MTRPTEHRESDHSTHWRVAVYLAVSMLVILALYTLSAGPATYLQMRGVIEIRRGSTWAAIYHPLNWVETHCRPFGNLMYEYGKLWYYYPPVPPPKTTPATSPVDAPHSGDVE